jgi:hypothetical protein
MIGFVLGALIGAGSIWYWGDRIRELGDSNMSAEPKSDGGLTQIARGERHENPRPAHRAGRLRNARFRGPKGRVDSSAAPMRAVGRAKR